MTASGSSRADPGSIAVVLVVRNKDVTFDAELGESFPLDVEDVESLTDLVNTVDSQFDGTEVTIKTFDELDS
ncbi:hypothetical protein [Haloarcula rara]|uniref:hypothetical protein n=1 Tax=Haloarcula rara TaxID=3033387 RepID=UPI0023E76352|nr:hypothetical protein [Halomicroarcula sp. SHR3]